MYGVEIMFRNIIKSPSPPPRGHRGKAGAEPIAPVARKVRKVKRAKIDALMKLKGHFRTRTKEYLTMNMISLPKRVFALT